MVFCVVFSCRWLEKKTLKKLKDAAKTQGYFLHIVKKKARKKMKTGETEDW